MQALDVRHLALELLRNANITVPKELWPTLPFLDESEAVRSEAFTYLSTIGDETAISLLEAVVAKEARVKPVATEARLGILLRTNPKEGFSEIIETGQYISEKLLRELEDVAPNFSDEILLKGTQCQMETVRKLSITELVRRCKLTKDLAEKFANDPSVRIREIALKELARQGQVLSVNKVKKVLSDESVPKSGLRAMSALLGGDGTAQGDVEGVVLAMYDAQPPERVSESVEWFSVNGFLAYKSLALHHFDVVGEQLRKDLDDAFKRIRQDSIAKMEATFGPETTRKMVEQFKEVDGFILSRFAEAALTGMLANGESSDIRFGRKYLTSGDSGVKLGAVRLIAKFGIPEDVPALLEIASNSWGETRDEAGIAALRLSHQPFEVAQRLLQNSSQHLVKTGFEWLYTQDSTNVRRFFEGLLTDDDAVKRVRAVHYFFQKLPSEDLEALLIAQCHQETYYYNVVAWLDRLLYSPKEMREFFIRDLGQQAS